MNKPLYKFYDLENLTQEDLNKLALERNTYKSIINKIKELIKSSGSYKGICTQPQTDTFSYILELLEEVDKGGELSE